MVMFSSSARLLPASDKTEIQTQNVSSIMHTPPFLYGQAVASGGLPSPLFSLKIAKFTDHVFLRKF